jgi:hypothetical protein
MFSVALRPVVAKIIGTGVRVTIARPGIPFRGPTSNGLRMEIEAFAEIDTDGETRRYGAAFRPYELPGDGDPAAQLVDNVNKHRESDLGNHLADMKQSGLDVTRFELYSAPFRIELSDDLRAKLAGKWRERDPRPDAWTWRR